MHAHVSDSKSFASATKVKQFLYQLKTLHLLNTWVTVALFCLQL